MSRTPPQDIIRQLRAEIGFGCPVPGCGNPYLEWHHFDPPYRVEAHHRSEGMIALCAQHHKKADAGAYTVEQLRGFKNNRVNAESVRGSFEWLRNKLLLVAGGAFYYETFKILQVDGKDVLWLRRDEDGYLRLNVSLPSLSPGLRAVIQDNFWSNIGTPRDLHSPPSGKALDIKYDTGDSLSVHFFELVSLTDACDKYGAEHFQCIPSDLVFPITVLEVNLTIANAGLSLTPQGTTFHNNIQFRGFVVRCGRAFTINRGLPWRENTTESQVPRFPRNALCPCGSRKKYKCCHGIVR